MCQHMSRRLQKENEELRQLLVELQQKESKELRQLRVELHQLKEQDELLRGEITGCKNAVMMVQQAISEVRTDTY